jgi:DNA-binding response OmpR family regulator
VSAYPRYVRVLIVEDEPATALLLEGMLEELGYGEVSITYDLADARDVLGEKPPDIAILDMSMGRENVLPLAEKMRAREVRVLLASTQPTNEIVPGWSGRSVVPKPFEKRLLARALDGLGLGNA